ncbi:hypothetical protein THF1D04_10717 [Vibrio owensii]|uniref:Uncharacterized protein n=1 Tax=Vibrio owensii TaxID=696485 RepID=A0AAU9PYW0_9VIBR|nr:hypothetical protein THF1D04_10717 [Vibrio owensii]
MSLIEHAKTEMELAWPKCDEMQDMVKKNVMELMEVFSNQRHSNFSAPYVLKAFYELANFKTIAPLTGHDEEWIEVGDDVYQNKRDGEVFKKGKQGRAYWIGGRVFRDESGTFLNGGSRVYIEFPWLKPEPEIVEFECWQKKQNDFMVAINISDYGDEINNKKYIRDNETEECGITALDVIDSIIALTTPARQEACRQAFNGNKVFIVNINLVLNRPEGESFSEFKSEMDEYGRVTISYNAVAYSHFPLDWLDKALTDTGFVLEGNF